MNQVQVRDNYMGRHELELDLFKIPCRSLQPSFSFCKEKTEIDTTATFGSMSTDKNLHRLEARLV